MKKYLLGILLGFLLAPSAFTQTGPRVTRDLSINGNSPPRGSITGPISTTYLNNIRYADQFAGVNEGVKINAAIADLSIAGGTVIDNPATPPTISTTVNVGGGNKRVYLHLGVGTYTCAVSPCFQIARGSELSGLGMDSMTVIQDNSAIDGIARILIKVLQQQNPSSGEPSIYIHDLDLRAGTANSTLLDASAMTDSYVVNIQMRKLELPVSSAVGYEATSLDNNTRNYRNHIMNLRCQLLAHCVQLIASGTNGPNSTTFTRLQTNGADVDIRANIANTTLIAPNIANTGGVGTGISNAGLNTAIINPYIGGWATGISNSGDQMRVINPYWDTNTVNVTSTGSESYCERCGVNGTSWAFNNGGGGWIFGGGSSGADPAIVNKRIFDVVYTNAKDGQAIRNVGTGNTTNDARIEYWLKNDHGAEINYLSLIATSTGITQGSEQSTFHLGCMSAGRGVDCLRFTGNAALFNGPVAVSNSSATISTGAGAPTGACVTGSLYTRTNGGAGSTLYVCESTAWVGK